MECEILIDSHVVRTNTDHPSGMVEKIQQGLATVRWGTADNRVYKEDIRLQDLQLAPFDIIPAE